ncbi:MAG TPA: hypothetical protein DDW50_20185, partial [Firmicutes bacterium]|nr:hypothetical protein [Bacillota bacterium]
KVCRFLSGEYVYDRGSDQILAGVNHAGEIDIKLTLEDCLAVYNTDNTKIFEHLVEALERIPDPKTRRQVSQIPIYFIEDSLENWCFLTQLFEFDKLKSWQNIHYFIASSGGITDIFMKEDAPWPNSFYGTDAESFTKSLLKIKQAKDFTFHQGLFELGNYYRTACLTPNLQPRKILIVTSKKEAALHYYGQVLEDYLVENGFECLLHIESSTFQNFTPYYDIKAMASFRPDLVINFLGVQEEFAAFNSLAVPFISWLLQEKQLNKTLEAHCPNQILLMTGNLNVKNNLLKQGYRPEQIHGVHLPVFPNIKTTSVSEWPEEEIGIITDLDDLEIVINDLATVIHGIIFMKTHTGSLPNIMAALRTLYFQVYAGLNQEELRPMDAAGYEKMLSENLQRYQINLSSDELKFLAGFVKTEFENLIFKRIQVKWVVDVFKDKRIGIYGSGWDQDPTYKNFFKGEINFFSHPEEYRNLILQSKVNLYLGGRLKNKSLMQPDLIQGIAYGGFFLIRKSPSLNPVESVWEPFGELLECYSSRTELFEKLNYFLTHPDERQKRARELQSHVLENFNMGSIIEKFWRLQ